MNKTKIVDKEVDMAPYVGAYGTAQRVDLSNSTIPGLYADVKWTILENDGITTPSPIDTNNMLIKEESELRSPMKVK